MFAGLHRSYQRLTLGLTFVCLQFGANLWREAGAMGFNFIEHLAKVGHGWAFLAAMVLAAQSNSDHEHRWARSLKAASQAVLSASTAARVWASSAGRKCGNAMIASS